MQLLLPYASTNDCLVSNSVENFLAHFSWKIVHTISCFSLVFLYCAPITLVLLPIVLFAVLHISSYTLTLLDLLGPGSLGVIRMSIGVVEVQSVNILRTISFAEIFIFPVTVMMFISGRATLMSAFVYYRFLTLRYASRRNPYSRNTFAELRVFAETYAQKPGCPEFLRNLTFKLIAFISRLAPTVAPPPAQ